MTPATDRGEAMGPDWEQLANDARSRSEVYALLAAVYREEPDRAFVEELRGPGLSRVFADMEVDLGESFYHASASEAAERLALEFTRLFLGPGGHLSPHESIFHENDASVGGLWGQTTVEVKNFIETTGLCYSDAFTGLPDHISVELEFMQRLADREAERWLQADGDSARYCRTVQQMFLERHMLRWVPQFCDAVVARAALPFYAALAELTRKFMEYERQVIVAGDSAWVRSGGGNSATVPASPA